MSEPKRIILDEKGLPVRKEDVLPEEGEACQCPVLDAADWDCVESDWTDIAFVRTTTAAVLGVPVGYDSVRDELRKKAAKLGATIPDDAMILNGEGRFRRPVMIEVEDAPDDAEVERPGGFVYTRLVQAPWGQLQKLANQAAKEAEERYGRKPDNLWIWYLTCRICSKARNFETLIVAHYRDHA